MMALLADQIKSLQPLFNTAAQASAALRAPLNNVEQFLQYATEFVRNNYARSGNNPYLLVFEESNPRSRKLNLKTLLDCLQKEKPVLYVDEGLRFVRAEAGDVRHLGCAHFTKQKRKLGIRVVNSYTWDFVHGLYTHEGDVLRPNAAEPVYSKFSHPISEFKQILQDHKAYAIAREQLVEYWKDPQKRILLSEPRGTEYIFHSKLFWWLDNYITDKLKVFGETRGMGQNKTDITVVTPSGSHVVEVKWLGTNGKSKYERERIDEGLAQINIYIENDNELVCGHLVIYDGRSLKTHQTDSAYDDSLRHSLCEPPDFLFLDSETPSVAATRIVKGRKR